MLKKFHCYFTLLLTIFLVTVFTACSKQSSNSDTLKVGTIAGPETELMYRAKDVAAKKYNVNVVIIEFSDYTLPNLALNDGSIDANMFQHLPYLNESIKARHYHLAVIGKTFIYPMGLYSKKINNLNQIATNALIAIPNDPSNSARALLLLEKAGLIQLNHTSNQTVKLADVIANPKNLKFKELDAAQLPRALMDVDIAAINSNYALPAGLYPSRDAVFIEGSDSDYANLVVARTDNKNDPRLAKLMFALHSDEVLQKANALFQAQAIPAWK